MGCPTRARRTTVAARAGSASVRRATSDIQQGASSPESMGAGWRGWGALTRRTREGSSLTLGRSGVRPINPAQGSADPSSRTAVGIPRLLRRVHVPRHASATDLRPAGAVQHVIRGRWRPSHQHHRIPVNELAILGATRGCYGPHSGLWVRDPLHRVSPVPVE